MAFIQGLFTAAIVTAVLIVIIGTLLERDDLRIDRECDGFDPKESGRL